MWDISATPKVCKILEISVCMCAHACKPMYIVHACILIFLYASVNDLYRMRGR